MQGISFHKITGVQNRILMFEGSTRNDDNMDLVFEYIIRENQWRELDCRLSIKMNGFGCVSILNRQYVILLGGESESEDQEDIFI